MNKMIAILLLVLGCIAFLYIRPPSYTVKVSVVSIKDIPDFSHLERISNTDIMQKIPYPQQGTIGIGQLRKSVYFDYMGVPIAPHKAAQKMQHPVALEIKSGVYRLSDLVDGEHVTQTQDGTGIHVPVIIHPEAALIIDQDDGPVILDTQKASFIANFGKLFVIGSVVKSGPTGYKHLWRETEYRPFITTWNGGESYFANSEFHDLGYSHSKSYGITFSTSAKMDGPAPKGMLIGNRFEGLYYGFYSHGAESVVIAHNVFKDNVVYGIDPHDYSRNLTIAFNDVSGTQRKHGIILSRGVSKSVIYKNKSHGNGGSGIMLERQSNKNIVVENLIEGNRGDGFALLESSGNASRDNKIEGNGKSGIRIRNSYDVHFYRDDVSGNAEYGIAAYSRSLTDQVKRNLRRDPYLNNLDFTMVECILSSNKKAAINVKNARLVGLSRLTIIGSPKTAAGDFGPYHTDIYAYGTQGDGIALEKKSYEDFFNF